jgi:hypothetical protein
VYCSRVCGNAATAVARNREKWNHERNQRLAVAKRALEQWSRQRTSDPFQEWASAKYKGLSKKFLTRAINHGDLPAPTKKKGA